MSKKFAVYSKAEKAYLDADACPTVDGDEIFYCKSMKEVTDTVGVFLEQLGTEPSEIKQTNLQVREFDSKLNIVRKYKPVLTLKEVK